MDDMRKIKAEFISRHCALGDCRDCAMNHWLRGCEAGSQCVMETEGYIIYDTTIDNERVSVLYHREIPVLEHSDVREKEFFGLVMLTKDEYLNPSEARGVV